MSLPIILSTGQIAIYGSGALVSSNGIIVNPFNEYKYGSVYHIWAGGETYIYGFDSVAFRERDVVNRINYGDDTFTIVPARLVTREEFAP